MCMREREREIDRERDREIGGISILSSSIKKPKSLVEIQQEQQGDPRELTTPTSAGGRGTKGKQHFTFGTPVRYMYMYMYMCMYIHVYVVFPFSPSHLRVPLRGAHLRARKPRPLPGVVSHTHLTRFHHRPIRRVGPCSTWPKTRLTRSRSGMNVDAKLRRLQPPVVVVATQQEEKRRGETEKR